jgi:acyl-CoA synthetase (AMP-forming)/AMP-acid ligase II
MAAPADRPETVTDAGSSCAAASRFVSAEGLPQAATRAHAHTSSAPTDALRRFLPTNRKPPVTARSPWLSLHHRLQEEHDPLQRAEHLSCGHRIGAAAPTAWTNERVGRQQRISGVVWRNSLPRNANGKILKRELRAELTRP